MTETPQISTSLRNAACYNLTTSGATSNMYYTPTTTGIDWTQLSGTSLLDSNDFTVTTTPNQKEPMPTTNRRVVQVYIVDPNESVPLDKSLLYFDEKPHLTDLTDQELFFEIDIKSVLDKFNQYRITVVDKEASEGKSKDVMLEAAKIRDLKMVVVNVASF